MNVLKKTLIWTRTFGKKKRQSACHHSTCPHGESTAQQSQSLQRERTAEQPLGKLPFRSTMATTRPLPPLALHLPIRDRAACDVVLLQPAIATHRDCSRGGGRCVRGRHRCRCLRPLSRPRDLYAVEPGEGYRLVRRSAEIPSPDSVWGFCDTSLALTWQKRT